MKNEPPFLFNLKKTKEGQQLLKEIVQRTKAKNEKWLECSVCGEQMETICATKIYPYSIGKEERKLTILNAPVYGCRNCGEKEESVFLYVKVEEMIGEEIFLRLNKRQEIPDKVDFSYFISE